MRQYLKDGQEVPRWHPATGLGQVLLVQRNRNVTVSMGGYGCKDRPCCSTGQSYISPRVWTVLLHWEVSNSVVVRQNWVGVAASAWIVFCGS